MGFFAQPLETVHEGDHTDSKAIMLKNVSNNINATTLMIVQRTTALNTGG
jgi:hypothetical protein